MTTPRSAAEDQLGRPSGPALSVLVSIGSAQVGYCWMVNSGEDRGNGRESRRVLEVYLRDHFAGSTAGLALARRCRRNAGTQRDDMLAGVEAEIEEDRRSLQAMMSRLDVTPSAVKSAVGSVAEVLGRLKGNGRIIRSSPSSPVVELEGLAAGIVTKRNLWRSLRVAAAAHPLLDVGELDRLIERATSQLQRVIAAHDGAAAEAFGRPAQQAAAARPDT